MRGEGQAKVGGKRRRSAQLVRLQPTNGRRPEASQEPEHALHRVGLPAAEPDQVTAGAAPASLHLDGFHVADTLPGVTLHPTSTPLEGPVGAPVAIMGLQAPHS